MSELPDYNEIILMTWSHQYVSIDHVLDHFCNQGVQFLMSNVRQDEQYQCISRLMSLVHIPNDDTSPKILGDIFHHKIGFCNNYYIYKMFIEV